MIIDDIPSSPPPAGAPRAHPLEVIPLFARWSQSTLRDLVYTALWSTLLGTGFTLGDPHVRAGAIPSFTELGKAVLVGNLIGFPIHAGLVLVRRIRLDRPHGRWLRGLAALAVYGASTAFGLGIGALLFGRIPLAGSLLHAAGDGLMIGLVVSVLMVGTLWLIQRRLVRQHMAARRDQQLAEAGRLLAEARLRALQAQIEPHFLYNTLANVVSLIGADPGRARHMLERLIDFLRASLSASRADRATLGAELDLAGAYLDLLTVRLGARLRYRIEADADVRALPIPPMLLQPLVENAVMHGIEPALAGGTILVRAHARDGAMVVEVSDDGAGLTGGGPRPGGGVGLSNLRERLRSLHGAGARLELLENPGGGVTARLLLPQSPFVPEVPPSPPYVP